MADYPLLCPTEDESRKGKGKGESNRGIERKQNNFWRERENKKGESLGFETLSFTFFPGRRVRSYPSPLSRFLKTAASYSPTVTQYHRHRWA